MDILDILIILIIHIKPHQVIQYYNKHISKLPNKLLSYEQYEYLKKKMETLILIYLIKSNFFSSLISNMSGNNNTGNG